MRDDNPFEDRPGGSIDRGFLIAAAVVLAVVAVAGGWMYLAPKMAIRLVPAASPDRSGEPVILPYGSGAPDRPPVHPAAPLDMPDPRAGRDNPAPTWRRVPAAQYPLAATEAWVSEGAVKMRCATLPTGALADCRILSETPPGYGFGDAAITASRNALVWPRRKDGVALPATISFTVRYVGPKVVDPNGQFPTRPGSLSSR